MHVSNAYQNLQTTSINFDWLLLNAELQTLAQLACILENCFRILILQFREEIKLKVNFIGTNFGYLVAFYVTLKFNCLNFNGYRQIWLSEILTSSCKIHLFISYYYLISVIYIYIYTMGVQHRSVVLCYAARGNVHKSYRYATKLRSTLGG
jgi:hypothetical protein